MDLSSRLPVKAIREGELPHDAAALALVEEVMTAVPRITDLAERHHALRDELRRLVDDSRPTFLARMRGRDDRSSGLRSVICTVEQLLERVPARVVREIVDRVEDDTATFRRSREEWERIVERFESDGLMRLLNKKAPWGDRMWELDLGRRPDLPRNIHSVAEEFLDTAAAIAEPLREAGTLDENERSYEALFRHTRSSTPLIEQPEVREYLHARCLLSGGGATAAAAVRPSIARHIKYLQMLIEDFEAALRRLRDAIGEVASNEQATISSGTGGPFDDALSGVARQFRSLRGEEAVPVSELVRNIVRDDCIDEVRVINRAKVASNAGDLEEAIADCERLFGEVASASERLARARGLVAHLETQLEQRLDEPGANADVMRALGAQIAEGEDLVRTLTTAVDGTREMLRQNAESLRVRVTSET